MCPSPLAQTQLRGRSPAATQEAAAQDGDSAGTEVPSPPARPGAVPCLFLLLSCPAPVPGRPPTKTSWQVHRAPLTPDLSPQCPASKAELNSVEKPVPAARMCFISSQLMHGNSQQPPQFWARSDLFKASSPQACDWCRILQGQP